MQSRRQRQPIKNNKNQFKSKAKASFNEPINTSKTQKTIKVEEVQEDEPKVTYCDEDEFEIILLDAPKKMTTIEVPVQQEEEIFEISSQVTQATS